MKGYTMNEFLLVVHNFETLYDNFTNIAEVIDFVDTHTTDNLEDF